MSSKKHESSSTRRATNSRVRRRRSRDRISLSVDSEYVLYGGDRIRCLKEECDGLFTCEFISAVPIRRDLVGQCDQWTSCGRWFAMPNGIFDVERELTP